MALFAATMSGTPTTASQPYSESLVECSAILEWTSELGGSFLGTGSDARELMRARADTFFLASMDQAKEEGIDDPFRYASAMLATKRAVYEDKSFFWAFGDGYKDWMAYCVRFARHLGVDLPGPE